MCESFMLKPIPTHNYYILIKISFKKEMKSDGSVLEALKPCELQLENTANVVYINVTNVISSSSGLLPYALSAHDTWLNAGSSNTTFQRQLSNNWMPAP